MKPVWAEECNLTAVYAEHPSKHSTPEASVREKRDISPIPDHLCSKNTRMHTQTHSTHTFNGPSSGTTRVSRYQKGKTNLKQETVSGSGISWAISKSAPRSRQTTMPAPHHSVFYRPDALPAVQPTASKHWKCTVQPHSNPHNIEQQQVHYKSTYRDDFAMQCS